MTSLDDFPSDQDALGEQKVKQKPHGRGCSFKLLEILVLVVVIGSLIAMFVPAVVPTREASRRIQCISNLKQITLACLNCESAIRHFPAGGWSAFWCGDPDRGTGTKQPGGPIYSMLPYMEQTALYGFQSGASGDARKTKVMQMIGTPIAGLICPSRRPVQSFPQLTGSDSRNFPIFNTRYVSDGELTGITSVARSDYAGNGYAYVGLSEVDALGTDITAAMGASGGSGGTGTAGMDVIFNDEAKQAALLSFMTSSVAGKAGIFFPMSTVTLDQISDGTANTYLFCEKYVNPDYYTTGREHGDSFDLYGGAGPDVLRYACQSSSSANVCMPAHDRPGYTPYESVWGSPHVSGFNMAFCDGSVHMISYKIGSTEHEQLSNRANLAGIDMSKFVLP